MDQTAQGLCDEADELEIGGSGNHRLQLGEETTGRGAPSSDMMRLPARIDGRRRTSVPISEQVDMLFSLGH